MLHGHAELVGDDHREGGGVTLAVGRRPGLDRDHAVVVHLDRGELGAAPARHLDVADNADPELQSVATPAALGLLVRGEPS